MPFEASNQFNFIYIDLIRLAILSDFPHLQGRPNKPFEKQTTLALFIGSDKHFDGFDNFICFDV